MPFPNVKKRGRGSSAAFSLPILSVLPEVDFPSGSISGSLFAKLLHPVFFMFGPSTAGTIYSFGYNLLTGCFLNFFMGVFCSRVMLYSISRFKAFRNPKLYGGV